jgi:hypothetical protein
MEITAQLDDEHFQKLSQIQQQTNRNLNDIFVDLINEAIDQRYRQLELPKKNIFEAFEEAGLVGCMSTDPDLSATYKSVINEYLEDKYQQGRL